MRIFADSDGETHFDEVEFELTPTDFAPPASPLHVSPIMPATGYALVRFPVGWVGDWHPTPRRQIFFWLAGQIEGEVSDGERRLAVAGEASLLEDTTGRGHRSWVVGDDDVLAAVVQLPEELSETQQDR
jgi:hypothetical protein